MTDYVGYTPAEYAPDAPATALHFQRWFENWIAGFQGDPTIHAAGLGLRAAAMREVAAGSEVAKTILGTFASNINKTNAGSGTLNAGPLSVGPALTALRAGTVTISAQLRHTVSGIGASGGMTLIAYKNGTGALTLTSTSTGYTTFTGNLSFVAGDVIEFALSTTGSTPAGGGSITADARQVKCLADIASFWCI